MPQANEIYRHFKGNLYKVMAVATHSETEEEMVVYQALYGDYKIYVRPLESFVSPVDRNKYPDANQEMRFQLISEAVNTDRLKPEVTEPEAVKPEATKNIETQAADSMENGTGITSACEGTVLLRPLVEEFLDADTIDERRRILAALRPTVTQDEITIMSTVMDIEIDEELELPERYRQLLICLDTKGKFETLRLR